MHQPMRDQRLPADERHTSSDRNRLVRSTFYTDAGVRGDRLAHAVAGHDRLELAPGTSQEGRERDQLAVRTPLDSVRRTQLAIPASAPARETGAPPGGETPR